MHPTQQTVLTSKREQKQNTTPAPEHSKSLLLPSPPPPSYCLVTIVSRSQWHNAHSPQGSWQGWAGRTNRCLWPWLALATTKACHPHTHHSGTGVPLGEEAHRSALQMPKQEEWPRWPGASGTQGSAGGYGPRRPMEPATVQRWPIWHTPSPHGARSGHSPFSDSVSKGGKCYSQQKHKENVSEVGKQKG